MIQGFEREIEGNKYLIGQFPAMKGMKLAIRIAKTLGTGASGIGAGKNLMDMDVGAVIGGICGALDEDATTKLIADLVADTTRNEKQLSDTAQFNTAFTGNYAELMLLLGEIIKVNYGSFLGALEQVKGGFTTTPTENSAVAS